MNYTNDEILTRMESLGMTSIPSNYWILGIRSADDHPDQFDDIFQLMKGDEIILETSGTTNPGLSILTGGFNRFDNRGAAILKSDEFYRDVWTYGLHLGKIPALLQRGAKVKIYRDGNKNHLSEEIGDVFEDWFGINFHLDQYTQIQKDVRRNDAPVGGNSAGCQVANIAEDYAQFIEAGQSQRYVSYCLLKEWSI